MEESDKRVFWSRGIYKNISYMFMSVFQTHEFDNSKCIHVINQVVCDQSVAILKITDNCKC